MSLRILRGMFELQMSLAFANFIKASFFQDVMVFTDPPNKKLFCALCNKVFVDPVIIACGVSK